MDNLLKPSFIKEEVENYKKEKERYLRLRDLYYGKHPILEKKTEGIGSNNKVVVNFIKTTIDTKVGYLTGEPAVIMADKDEDTQNLLDAILKGNNFPHLMQELVKDMCIVGKGYLFLYQDSEGMTRFVRVPIEEVIINKEEDGKINYVIRYFYMDYIEDGKNKGKRLYIELYTDKKIHRYTENDKGELEPYSDIEDHIYNGVPIVEFLNNEEGMDDTGQIEDLNHIYNKMMSAMADENEDIRNYYMKFYGMNISDEIITNMRFSKAIEIPEGGEMKFERKDASTESLESFMDRLKKEIYRIAQVPNMEDESFAGNSSGVAIRYKMLAFENGAKIKEREIVRSINSLLTLLEPVIKLKAGKAYNLKDYTIQIKRNMPVQVEVSDVIALAAAGILDDKTLLGLLPFVEDPSSVIEKLRNEVMQEYGTDYNMNGH